MTADMPAQDLRSLPCSTQGSVQDMIRPGCTGRKQSTSGRPAKAVLVVAPVVSRETIGRAGLAWFY
jgi:hypothetical protein